VELVGLVGDDHFGGEVIRQMAERGLSTDGIFRGPAEWQTLVYAKPYRGFKELNRIDFGAGNPFVGDLSRRMLARLEAALPARPVVVINQQVQTGWSAQVVPELNALIARHPEVLFVVDSRHHAHEFTHAALKLNTREALRVLGKDPASPADPLALAAGLAERQGRPVLLTRGEEGVVLAAGGELFDIPGIELPGEADSVGAGDAALAGFAAALAAGGELLEAGMLANLAAAVTTRQIRTTGTATPAQLRSVGPVPDYVHAPRLAAHPELARFLGGTDIELVTGRPPSGLIRHAIFDHDGTISTLRQGWEGIMEPMMVQAVLSAQAGRVDDETLIRVTSAVRVLIDRTTGIQTLAQMKNLVDLVRQFGFVAEDAILDEHGYKAVFNRDLVALVGERMRRIERGELGPEDWQVKGARHILERLRGLGVTLHLASGTDQADVAAEARALGYADLFDGGIHGSVGDLRIEAKRVVLERIMAGGGIGGEELLVVGDGPVEIREGRRRGAYTVGIASDEVRRHGISLAKRERLIRAGADIIIPDFTQAEALLSHLKFPAR
jgi:sugar/nucleoside kinase (ribokinase family)/phosphoglycolate phosphatase-like HAD superfamily hydrolase